MANTLPHDSQNRIVEHLDYRFYHTAIEGDKPPRFPTLPSPVFPSPIPYLVLLIPLHFGVFPFLPLELRLLKLS